MDKRSYAEKLRDPRWQKIRLKVFERDNWACKSCGETTKTLHVHHKLYEKGKEPWEYPLEYLLTLCEPCHDKEFTHRPDMERRLLVELKRAGFLADDLESLLAELLARESVEFQGALIDFLDCFWAVFDHDWFFTKSILCSDEIGWYISDGGTFINPMVEDESNNWGNRGGLLARYRLLLSVMENLGIPTVPPRAYARLSRDSARICGNGEPRTAPVLATPSP